eukprot:TRINITY_DN11930_c0_g1_i1.p1 TRINITY_DN11930_c0_g1~~TRINITY_DN11930_c0_g1_i1.p1  ORF type:complete len:160 (+),score=25.02 TRINITY_DN11930_c0_g1_i1:457-936(+)
MTNLLALSSFTFLYASSVFVCASNLLLWFRRRFTETQMSARTATLFVALLSTALVASATFGVCPIDVTKTSAAKAVITRPGGAADGDLMTVLFQVPMETLGGASVPNFLRTFRFSSSCGLTWSATTINTDNTPARDIDGVNDDPFAVRCLPRELCYFLR